MTFPKSMNGKQSTSNSEKQQSEAARATSPITRPFTPSHLADVAESVDVWHGGGLVGAHHYFPRLLVELHAELVQAQDFAFRGSAWETGQGEDCVTAQERLSM